MTDASCGTTKFKLGFLTGIKLVSVQSAAEEQTSPVLVHSWRTGVMSPMLLVDDRFEAFSSDVTIYGLKQRSITAY